MATRGHPGNRPPGLLLVLFLVSAAPAKIIYVDDNAEEANAGFSWTTAHRCLQDALVAAASGDEIHVAKGIYPPDRGAGVRPEDRSAFFHLKSGVSLKGGYAGLLARDPNACDPKLYPTILNGDLKGNDVLGLTLDNFLNYYIQWDDNSFRVVATETGDTNCILDGFVISGGVGTAVGSPFGGGFYCAPRSSPVIRNCIFSSNYAYSGGGIACLAGHIILEGCSFQDNVALSGGGLYVGGEQENSTGGSVRLKDCTFTGNSAEGYGGAVSNSCSHLEMTRCSLRDNSARTGGAIYGRGFVESGYDLEMTDCLIEHNRGASAIATSRGEGRISGTVRFVSDRWDTGGMALLGDGTLWLDSGSMLAPSGWGIIGCNISGAGAIEVPADVGLIILGQARVEVARIDCRGLLRLCASAQIVNSRITTRRASFEDDVIVSNSMIVAEAGAPYGQFFIEHTARVSSNEIYADGDRYMDLDPSVFAGLIENNRIHVTVTEGIGNKRGGLFELRGRPGMVGETACDPNNPFLCRVRQVPNFDPSSWMMEELRLVDGTQLNLTNRFDFQPPYDQGGHDEVLYVRNLYLGKGAVLNTSFNTVYYENLFADPCAVVKNVPLLGFSLNNIAFDDDDEFAVRVATNNVVPEAGSGQPDRIYVRRVAGREPDPCGVMEMRNLAGSAPNAPTSGRTVQARAKGLFAKSNEPWIQIRFEYLFTDPAGGAALMIYLSDIPELLDRDDPLRKRHYREVARLPQPPAGRFGTAPGSRWGVFEQVVPVGDLNFVRGTRVELELIGPAGTCVFINNWDPAIRCTYTCGDVAGAYHQVNEIDFLAALSECGRRIDAVAESEGRYIGCLDGFFCADGYVTIRDALAVDWIAKKSFCPDEWLAHDLVSSAPPASTPKTALASAGSPGMEIRGQLLIAAKRYQHREGEIDDFLSDRLYGLDSSGRLVSGPFTMTKDRFNGKLIRDPAGHLYQLNLELGLVRLADGAVIVAPGSLSLEREPRYGESATAHVGLQEQEGAARGRPLLDAVFDAHGYLYVVPVVVAPTLREPYMAAAKLKLGDTSQNPSYSIEQLFDEPPLTNDNQALSQLREVEVDGASNVHVLNCHSLNGSDVLWVYSPNGQLLARRDLQDLGISAPVGLCVSTQDGSRLYLSSSENHPDARRVQIYVLSTATLALLQAIEIHNMGHVTDMAENPGDGTLCVVGFEMPVIPSESQIQDIGILSRQPFYRPRLATIAYDHGGYVQAVGHGDAPVGTDMALPLAVIWITE